MTWLDYYQPPEKKHWQGRPDSPPHACFFQHIQFLNLRNPMPPIFQRPTFALLGFACDEGIRRNGGRLGAAEGPVKLKQTLAPLPLHHAIACFDAGLITCDGGQLEEAQQALGQAVHLLLSQGFTPIVLGGGHELAWGHYQGIAAYAPSTQLGIINFDAHFDMRPLLDNQRGSSGTPFLQIATAHDASNRHFDYSCIGIQPTGNTPALFETASHYQTRYLLAEDIHLKPRAHHLRFINRSIKQNEMLYVSLCLDVIATAHAPGVSAPQAMGLYPWQLVPLLRQLAASGKVVSYDIAELSPPNDNNSQTAKLAAYFIYDLLCHHLPITGNLHD
ncbi:MAG: formimidoylglutamase [Gammaproteobacteria bacterium]|nr:formimidoylglutamase [Gammaproteobacteria bacterium]